MKKLLLALALMGFLNSCKKDECNKKVYPIIGNVEFNEEEKHLNFSYCGEQLGQENYFSIGGYSETGDFSCYAYFKGSSSPALGSYDVVVDTAAQTSGEATILVYQISENDGALNYRSLSGELEVRQEYGTKSVVFADVAFEELSGKTEDRLGSGNISCN